MSRTPLLTVTAIPLALAPHEQTQTLTGQGALSPSGQRPAGPPRDDQQQRSGTVRIRGRVVAADTGHPLRRVMIRASSQELRESRMTSTDGEGGYELKDLPAGRYNLSASKGSYVTLSYGQ